MTAEAIFTFIEPHRRWTRISWDPTEDECEEQRWSDAIPKMATALAEVGIHSHYAAAHPQIATCRHVMTFDDDTAPDDAVLLKAGQLCGVGDLMEALIDKGCRCQICRLTKADRAQ